MNDWIYLHDLDPILFTLGPVKGTWYGLMYAIGFIAFYWAGSRAARRPGSVIREEDVAGMLTYAIIGVIVGGRLGYVFFYGGMPYFLEPIKIIQTWKGGMSFHGAIIGIMVAVIFFHRRHRYTFLQVTDFGVTWASQGLFFGRMGNFINGELYGKPTGGGWGVIFPHDAEMLPRHPSQLYEAVLEGLVIFIVLVALRFKVAYRPGLQSAVFLMLYGFFRILVEFVRLPDYDIGYSWGFVTRGQMLSLPMMLAGLFWLVIILRRPLPEPAPTPAPTPSQAKGKKKKRKNR